MLLCSRDGVSAHNTAADTRLNLRHLTLLRLHTVHWSFKRRSTRKFVITKKAPTSYWLFDRHLPSHALCIVIAKNLHWSWAQNSGKSDHPKQWQSAAEWSETDTTKILQYFKNMKQISLFFSKNEVFGPAFLFTAKPLWNCGYWLFDRHLPSHVIAKYLH